MVLLPLLVQAQATVDRQWSWTAPTTGTPAVKYYVQVSAVMPISWVVYATTTDTTLAINVPYDWEYVVRVQAEDSYNRIGPFSEVSDPDIVIGAPPGPCGKPRVES